MFASSKVGEVPERLSAEGNDPVEKEMWVKLEGGENEGIISGQLSGAKAGSREGCSVTPMSLV